MAHKADNLTTIYEPECLENVGASTSHNPKDVHALLQGQLYLFFLHYIYLSFLHAFNMLRRVVVT
jgi:hypothetical protein